MSPRKYYCAKHPTEGYLTHYDGPLVQHTLSSICEELREHVFSDWARANPKHKNVMSRKEYRENLNVFARKAGWRIVRVDIVEVR